MLYKVVLTTRIESVGEIHSIQMKATEQCIVVVNVVVYCAVECGSNF